MRDRFTKLEALCIDLGFSGRQRRKRAILARARPFESWLADLELRAESSFYDARIASSASASDFGKLSAFGPSDQPDTKASSN